MTKCEQWKVTFVQMTETPVKKYLQKLALATNGIEIYSAGHISVKVCSIDILYLLT